MILLAVHRIIIKHEKFPLGDQVIKKEKQRSNSK